MLAVEVFNKTNGRGVPCDLVTGEERKAGREDGEPANHIACTVEMTNCQEIYDVSLAKKKSLLIENAVYSSN